MSIKQGFPVQSTPFVNEVGLINPVWYQFLVSLAQRTGGATGVDAARVLAAANVAQTAADRAQAAADQASRAAAASVQSVSGHSGIVVLGFADIAGLAAVAHTGNYGDVAGAPAASASWPLVDGVAATGKANAYAREDHVHPTDTTRRASADGTFPAGIGLFGRVPPTQPAAPATLADVIAIIRTCGLSA